jgi:cytochrome c oxidase assembly factor CtaG
MTTQQFFTSEWGWHPAVIAMCALALAAYARFRGFRFSGRSIFLLAAVAVFFLALASPIAVLADGYLFSAHMLQHLLLQLVVPPLLLLSLPAGGDPKPEIRNPKEARNPKSERAEPHSANRALSGAVAGRPQPSGSIGSNGGKPRGVLGFRISGFLRISDFGFRISPPSPARNAEQTPLWFKPVAFILRRPLITWFLGLGAMWLWHVPSLCSASATNPWVHAVQGVSLLLMGTAFWWPIIGPWRSQWLPPLIGVLYLFSACVGCTILGIILTFAPLGVCPVFMHPADQLGILPLIQDNWGLSPGRDQQLGGLLMWVPPCFVYLCGIFGLFARWYTGPDPELASVTDTEFATEQPGLGRVQPLRGKA